MVGQTSEWDMLHVASSKSLGVQLPVLINRRPTAMCQLRADFTKCFPYSLQFCVPFDLGMWPIWLQQACPLTHTEWVTPKFWPVHLLTHQHSDITHSDAFPSEDSYFTDKNDKTLDFCHVGSWSSPRPPTEGSYCPHVPTPTPWRHLGQYEPMGDVQDSVGQWKWRERWFGKKKRKE